nr:hypothetical protein [Tanacetum cinerariifolium]
MISTPGEPDLPVPVPESFHEQTDKELTENDIKRMDADDQAIQTILLGLLEDVYAAVDSCETAKEIWERVQQMMKGSDIGEQEKKAKLFNEWVKFTSTDGESIESYYHRFMKLMNDLKRNKHFPENIASNLKFLNNLQPEWKRHVTIVRQTKNLHEADFTEIYDFLKMNRDEDKQTQNVGGNGGNQFGQYAGQVAQNQQGYNAWQNGRIQVAQNTVQNAGVQNGRNQNGLVVVPGIANQNGTGNVVAAKAEEEFDFMAAPGDLDEIEEVNANCILMANLQHASTSGTQLDKALLYDTDGSAEVHLNDNCYDNEIFNMFTQDEQYTDLLEPIPEPQLVPRNDNHVTSVAPSMVQSGGTVETSSAPNEETRVFVPQTTKSKEELFLSNVSNMVTVSKMISIPNQDLSDDTTPSVARKFLNEVKNSLVTLKRVVEQKMTLEVHNWSSSAHKELRSRVFENTSESMKNTSGTSVTPHVDKPKRSAVTPHSKKLHASIPVYLVPSKQSSASIKTNSITSSQRHVIFKEKVSSDMVTASSTGLVHTAKTKRPQPKGNTRNARAPSASKSSEVKKNVNVEDHRKTLLLFKNQKTMSSECNNIKLAIRNDKSKIICGKDCAQNVKNQSKTGQYQHKIGSQQQKPDQRAIFSNNQEIKLQKSKIQSSGSFLAN